MLGKVRELYEASVDGFMEWIGYATRENCIAVFGGVPKLQRVGLVGVSGDVIGKEYIELGPFSKAYKIITEAAKEGIDEVTLTSSDLGESSLFSFDELKRLKGNAEKLGIDCLIRGIGLYFDMESIASNFPEQYDRPAPREDG